MSSDASMVLSFAVLMNERMEDAAERGKDGWEECSLEWLLNRAKQEFGELRRAVESGNAEHIAHEAADVANFCGMIATIAKRRAD